MPGQPDQPESVEAQIAGHHTRIRQEALRRKVEYELTKLASELADAQLDVVRSQVNLQCNCGSPILPVMTGDRDTLYMCSNESCKTQFNILWKP